MARLELRKLLRGAHREALEQILALLSAPARIEDTVGRVVLGDAEADGERYPIRCGDDEIGAVIGPATAARVAAVVAHLYEKELEKRALADETLGRYKELTLLYDMSEKLSKFLDLEAVGASVAEDARRHLRASGAALLLHDPRRNVLEAVASVGDEFDEARDLPADRGIAGRVLRTGRAEFLEDVATTDAYVPLDTAVRSLICAPLRTGERVFGVLRVTQTASGAMWTAGDVKLVAALAANAASAISNAQLHRERMRELALRHQVERFVSPRLLEAVFDGPIPATGAHVAIAFCDLRQVTSVEPDTDPERLIRRVEFGVTAAFDAFVSEGAVVDAPQGELVVGVFWDAAGLGAAAARAIRASQALMRRLEREGRGGPGVGIASAAVPADDALALRAGINAAAVLQSESEGRVLVDYDVIEAVGQGIERVPVGSRDLPRGRTEIFEVRA